MGRPRRRPTGTVPAIETAFWVPKQWKSFNFLAGSIRALLSGVKGIGKRFVYILRSEADPNRHYVGNASDVDERLEWHNHGPCGFTVSHHRPWRLAVSIEFPTELEALRFERYLKSGSGRVFAKGHSGTA